MFTVGRNCGQFKQSDIFFSGRWLGKPPNGGDCKRIPSKMPG